MFRLLDVTKMKVLKELEELDSKDDNSELDDSLRLKRMEVVNQLRVINKKKLDWILHQKARASWLKEGAQNITI